MTYKSPHRDGEVSPSVKHHVPAEDDPLIVKMDDSERYTFMLEVFLNMIGLIMFFFSVAYCRPIHLLYLS